MLKKLIISGIVFLTCNMAFAEKFTCPLVQDLKSMDGFYIEYPLSINVQTQEADNSWIVAKINIQQTKKSSTFDMLLVSPVIAAENEDPSDASFRMIDSVQPYEDGQPDCENLGAGSSLCICAYWNSNDGSWSSFTRLENKAKSRMNQDEMNKILSAQMKKIQYFKKQKSQ